MNKFRGFVRDHLGAAIAATAAAVVLVGGILILTFIGSGSGAPASAAASTTTTTLAPSGSGSVGASGRAGGGVRRQGVRGAITAITGDTWTVMSAAGAPVTVDVTATTAFGTKKVPLTASDFSAGDRIVVVGARTGTTVTATRIALAAAGAGAAPTTTTP